MSQSCATCRHWLADLYRCGLRQSKERALPMFGWHGRDCGDWARA